MVEKRTRNVAGTLYVVATPIGNLEDVTLRAIRTLKQVDLIAAEDTRHTRRLLTAHGIKGRLVSYHEHNEEQRSAELLEHLQQGRSLALVSDAGTPTVSDPGYRLVQAAAARRITIVPIPGVSAAITALCASGLATDNFTFAGFVARKKNRRLEQLKMLAQLPHTLIFYESPRRIATLVEELHAVAGDRQAVLARELTKLHEEFIHGTLSELLVQLSQRTAVKGECTLLVAGAGAPQTGEAELEAAVVKALSQQDRGSLSDIAKSLSKRFNVRRKQVYDLALKMRDKRDE